jgi:hypothetical protein
LRNRGFTKGDTLAEQEDRWIIEGDSVRAFIDRWTYVDFGSVIEHSKTYAKYVRFCEKHRVTPASLNRFVKEFQEITRVENCATRTADRKPIRVWRGINIKNEEGENNYATLVFLSSFILFIIH